MEETPGCFQKGTPVGAALRETVKTPKKAFILAAGFGTRMLPLSTQIPKPLLPIWGVPVIDRLCSMLESWGTTDILVNLHHGAGAISDHFMRSPRRNSRLSFSFEPEILGTGGAVRKASWFLDPDDPFWLINGDIAADVSPLPFLRLYEAEKPLSVLWLTDTKGPRTVELNGHRISTFRSGTPGAAGTYTFCGLHLLSPGILDYIPPRGEYSIISSYDAATADRCSVLGTCPANAYWADIGTPEGYLAAHAETREALRGRLPGAILSISGHTKTRQMLRKTAVAASGMAAVASDAYLAPGTTVRNSVVLAGVRMEEPASIVNAVVAPGVHLQKRGANIDFFAMPLRAMCSPRLDAAASGIGFRLDRTTVLPFRPRGSARSFFRLCCGRRSAIAVLYDPERAENCFYAANAGILEESGVNVPAILLDRPDICALVAEDVGDASLLDLVNSGKNTVRLYKAVLDQVALVHSKGTATVARRKPQLSEPFSVRLYSWERKLFADYFLRAQLRLDEKRIARVLGELRRAGTQLAMEPLVLVHRDLQSSNVLFNRGRPVFIDFQGMRLGPAPYDIASLLCDPYVSLPLAEQMHLLEYYDNISGAAKRETTTLFWWAAVQRLAQALGAFGRLSANPATKSFARHIAPAMKMMDRALGFIDNAGELREVICESLETR
ncbi:MAG: hypothetical protein C0404_14940 [Verrucomicrobia bacterium]|nr:hypothetical protein [Verrucomicrobiota bacterium]